MRLLTIPEVARVLHVRTERAYQLARDGVLPVVRLGRQVRVNGRALDDWVAQGGRHLERHQSDVEN